MASYANQKEGSTSLGAENCDTATTLVGSCQAQRSGVIRRPDRGLPVSGGCEQRSPAKWCHTRTKQNEASPSLGAANCETVATFVGSGEAQRSDCVR